MIKQERYEYLDALRGSAALSVVVYHMHEGYHWPPAISFLDNTPLHALWDGKAAVELFFVLSGFVLSLKYVKHAQGMNGFSYLGYSVSRFFRLMPAFIAVLLLSAMAKNFIFYPYATEPAPTAWLAKLYSIWEHPIALKQVLQQALLIIRIPTESFLRVIPQDWSLTIELQQSLLLPILIILALRSQLLLLVLFAGFMIAKPATITFNFYLGLVIAQNMAFIRRKWQESPSSLKYAVFILAIVLYSVSPLMVQNATLRGKLVAVGCSLIIIVALCSKDVQRVLSLRALAFLGKISYSLYLCHFTIIFCFVPFFLNLLNRYGITNDYFTRFSALTLVVIFSVLISNVSYNLIEKPFIKFGKQFSNFVSKYDFTRSLPQLVLEKSRGVKSKMPEGEELIK